MAPYEVRSTAAFTSSPPDAAELLALVSQDIPDYRHRDGQVALVNALLAIQRGGVLYAHAECGIGKTAAQLIEAAVAAARGERTVILTSTNMLASQIMREACRIQRHLPFTIARVMGVNNYVCPRALAQARAEDAEAPGGDAVIPDGVDLTGGDMTHIKLPAKVRRRLTVTSDECLGRKCKQYAQCHYQRARAAAMVADVVVTNHVMGILENRLRRLTADNEDGPIRILGDFHHLRIDEGDKLENAARDKRAITTGGIRAMLRRVQPEQGEALRRAAETLFASVELFMQGDDGAISAHNFTTEIDQLVEATRTACRHPVRCSTLEEDEANAKRNYSMLERVEALNNGNQALAWTKGKIELQRIDVSQILSRMVTAPRSTALLSGTLAIGGNFDAIQRGVGVPGTTIICKSPFDYRRMACIVDTGIHYSYESRTHYLVSLALRVKRIIEGARGGVLILCASRADATYVYKVVAPQLPADLRLLCQPDPSDDDNDETIGDVIEQFKSDPKASLIGVASLWTGLDAPGDTCRVVVVTRLPIVPPNDPLMAAIARKLGGGIVGRDAAYDVYGTPLAMRAFEQGCARLMRTNGDYGVVIMLDGRIMARHGHFLKCLPPAKLVTVKDPANYDQLQTLISKLRSRPVV